MFQREFECTLSAAPREFGFGLEQCRFLGLMRAFAGGKVVLMEGSLDPGKVWRVVGEEGVNLITVVGDAVAKPLLDAWDAMPEEDRPDVSVRPGQGRLPIRRAVRPARGPHEAKGG